MRFVNRKKLSSAVAAAMVGIGCAHTARAVIPEYTILDLNTLGGTTSEAYGINNAGQIIGRSFTTGTSTFRGFLTSPNSAINPATDALPILTGGGENRAYGINSTGVVTGWSASSAGTFAVRYNAGSVTSFGTLGGGNSYGQAINNIGEIAGSALLPKTQGNFPTHAVLYSGPTIKDLGTITSGDDSFAYSINSNGTIVGYSGDQDQLDHATAFVWTPTTANGTTGSMVRVGSFGGNFSYAFGINDGGQIVGASGLPGDSVSHAFLKTGATMSDLGTLGGTTSEALGINNISMVVGDARNAAAVKHAFLYANGTIADLNNLIPAGSNWTLQKATAINDLAQIVGIGINPSGESHGFLLTPLPTWAVNSDGNWSGASNWLGAIPTGSGAEVRLTGAITAAHTVTLDSPRTIGHLVFDNANRYTLGGTSTLTINGSSATTGIEVRSGNHTIGAPVTFTSTATISLAASSSLKLSGLVKGPMKSLQLGTNATLDLTNNNLVIDYAPADGSPIGTLTTSLSTGRNGGLWNGTGITSSTAASDATHKTAIGSADASALGVGSFLGQSVDTTTVLLRYTLNGDANLDGTVNALDFNRLATNFGASNRGWSDGNFDYAGTVNTTDFNLLAGNFGSTMPASGNPLGTLIPEPASILLLISTLLLTRYRRHP